MQESVNLREFKKAWQERLKNFKDKARDYANVFEKDMTGGPDISVDDLVNPPQDEKIENEINSIVRECLEDPKCHWHERMKKDYLKTVTSELDFVNNVKDNLDTVRQEPLNVAMLLSNKSIFKAEDLESEVASLSLHSFKDIDRKAKMRPVEKNYLMNPLGFLKEKEKQMKLQKPNNPDLIINVTIYHSFTGKKSQEFQVLGSQTLTALRDKIYCVSDHLEEKLEPSSFFFINNTFYNDLRFEASKDLSKEIISNQEKKLKKRVLEQEQPLEPIEVFKTANMDEVRFEDLEIVMGKPYLYRHQSSCDHLFIFNDVRIRLKDNDDLAHEKMYPLNIFQNRIKRRRCNACFLYFAKIMCFNDKMQSNDPSYFCDKCYMDLHFTPDGKPKVSNFQVYPYIHE